MDSKYEETTPWPDACPDNIIFTLDAANAVEKQLLEDWILSNKPESISSEPLIIWPPNKRTIEWLEEFWELLRIW